MPDISTVQLREMSRWHDELNGDLRRLSNRLRELLQRYFPAMLQLCPAADDQWFWELLRISGADPEKARRVRTDRIARVLRAHGKRAVTAGQVVAVFRSAPLRVAPGTTQAVASRVEGLIPQLTAVHTNLNACERRIAELVGQTGRRGEILRSYPGIGNIVSAVILAEAHDLITTRDLGRLRAQAGVAPVTKRSGKSSATNMRRACNHRLRWAVRQWAFTAARCDPYAKALYDRMKARGLSHERALRGVGDRLLSRLIATLRDDALYDAERRGAAAERIASAAA